MLLMDKPLAYVIFCDDVRQEVGDKRTFVGVYGTELFVPEIPTLIPKFYAVTTLICYRKKTPKELTIRLTYCDEEIAKVELESKELKAWYDISEEELSLEEKEFPETDPPKMRVGIEMLISPFVVRREGRMASHVFTEGGTVRAGSMRIMQKDGVESTALPMLDKGQRVAD